VFRSSASLAWCEVVVDEIAAAKRDKLEWEQHLADAGSGKAQDEAAASVERVELISRDAREGAKPVLHNVPMAARLVQKHGKREIYELTGRLDDVHELKILISGTRGAYDFPEPYDALPRAARAVLGAIEKLASWPGVQLPAYAVDIELVAWLVERMGFEGGGGRGGTISAKRMIGLLSDPALLAEEILAFAERLAERGDDEVATNAHARFGAMAARVRLRGRSCERSV
jgi:hypothetical protein